MAAQLPPHKQNLIDLCLSSGILKFGTFTLKSGRQSPYFFNCGLFSTCTLAKALSHAYAITLSSHAESQPEFEFDVLFGPAYKGIPVAATTCAALGDVSIEKYGNVGYTFNRKEAKTHGEGGSIVGQPLKGKRVVIVDDVITAGTAIREAVEIIKSEGGTLVGIAVALDRQEKTVSESEKAGKGEDGSVRPSTVEVVAKEVGVPVLAVLTLQDLIKGIKGSASQEEVKSMEEYRSTYGAVGSTE